MEDSQDKLARDSSQIWNETLPQKSGEWLSKMPSMPFRPLYAHTHTSIPTDHVYTCMRTHLHMHAHHTHTDVKCN